MCCGSLITLLLSNFNLLGVHLLFIKSLCCCADHPCSRLCLQSRRAVIKNLKNMQHVRESASPAVSVTFRISKVVQLQCVFCNKRGLQSNNCDSQWDTHSRVACNEAAYPVTNTANTAQMKTTVCLLTSRGSKNEGGWVLAMHNCSCNPSVHFLLLNQFRLGRGAEDYPSCHRTKDRVQNSL